MTANPTLLSMPLAQNGQKNVIPETQTTPGNGLFSQSTGFPAETSLPLGAGGVAPSREDFNGMANLLGGVAFYAQKGFTFNYDATQDYYVGCIVIDPSDGLRYECITDMTAGTIAPHDDTTNTYWTIFKSGLDRAEIPAFNYRDVITTSGTFTATVTGWHKITVKGGGGGGGGGYKPNTNSTFGGGGGGEGGTTIAYEYMSASDTATVVIGAGGTGGAVNTNGTDGGISSVAVNNNTYTSGGGGGGAGGSVGAGGTGGTGTIKGATGGIGDCTYGASTSAGGSGGGNGGGYGSRGQSTAGTDGGGGSGGVATSAGAAGGDGYVWFEYFAEV